MSNPSYILGIETSCDETACALVDAQGRIAANEVASQVDLHAQFGGVVPEVASRCHVEVCLPLIETMIERSGIGWDEVSGVAVTWGPGLIGCLLMGLETAKALAWSKNKPLYAVHHLDAHLFAPYLTPNLENAAHLLVEDGKENFVLPNGDDASSRTPEYPHVGLIVSGGHTALVWVRGPGRTELIAQTLDDAVGEAYDKVARVMELGYPGGPVVDRLAAKGDPKRFEFTRPLMKSGRPGFSFSGLKSALARKVEAVTDGNGNSQLGPESPLVWDLCAGFQAAAVDVLVSKSIREAADRESRDLVVAGGVACNSGLRRAMTEAGVSGIRVWFPHPSLCTDNAAMIAGLAWHLEPLDAEAALELNPQASLAFGASV